MKINTLYHKDKQFPIQLTPIDTPPARLYYRGILPENYEHVVAIVGTRKPSPYGIQMTRRLTAELSQYGITIVSGLALGIDSIAHQATIEAGGTTIAVLPTGLEKTYPASNHQLAERIIKSGGLLISENRSVQSIRKHDFLIRNRIISGLSRVVIIIESASRGGSLNTASHALEQGKTVMAVPGNVTSPTSAGTNELIKNGALTVTSVDDILLALGIDQKKQQTKLRFGNSEQQHLYSLIVSGVHSQAELSQKVALPQHRLSQLLTELELSGHISSQSGQWYSKK